MAVVKSSDNKLTPKEKLHRLLGLMLDQDMSDDRRKQLAEEFGKLVEGKKINSTWMTEFGLKGTTGVEEGMGYIDIFLPPESIPQWYKVKVEKENADPRPKVRFYLSMRDTNGSNQGIGPVMGPGDNPLGY